MSKFKIIKNGYDIAEVDNYIFSVGTDYENKLQEQKMRISDMKRELAEVNAQLNSFKQKNSNISDALVVAVETAKRIDGSSKNIYELEVKRVRKLYDKWQKFLDDFMKKYPELRSKYDTKMLLQMFSDDIDKILNQNKKTIEQKEAIAVDSYANDDNSLGLRMLINKMNKANGSPLPTSNFPLEKGSVPIMRNDSPSEDLANEYQVNATINEEAERLAKDQIRPITNMQMGSDEKYENLVDKFLSSDDKGCESSAYSKILLEKKKNDQFNLKEAVTPTEDLDEIMKSFSFYPENEQQNSGKN